MLKYSDLKISRKIISRNLIYLLIIYVCIYKFINTQLGAPSFISYFIDLIMFFLIVINFKYLLFNKLRCYKTFLFWVSTFLIFSIITLIIRQNNFLLFLWAARNNFRFFIFLLLSSILLEVKDIEKIFSILFRILWINVFVCTFQFFVQGYKGDYCGGLFGIEQGSNAYMNILLLTVTIISIVKYILKQKSFVSSSFIILACTYIASLSELKIYVIELAIILILLFLFTRISFRKLIIIFVGIFTVHIAIKLIIFYNPQWQEFFNFSNIIENFTRTSGYTGSGDLNRFTGISTISDSFLINKTDLLMGKGLGSCEYSSFEFLTSEFYKNYYYLHYQWFYSTFMFIECGYIGLSLLIGFYIISFIYSTKLKKVYTGRFNQYNIICQIFSICCIFLIFYDCSLRMEISYIAYFIISIPIIISNECKKISNI